MPEKKIKKGAPPWMATFADLSTLLMTFFVLLLSMANIDVQEFREMLGAVRQAFGVQFDVHGEFQAVMPKELAKVDQPEEGKVASPSTRIQEARTAMESRNMARDIKSFVDQSGMADQVNVNAGTRGVRLRVKGQLMFEPGGVNVREQAHKLLQGVGTIMKKYDFYLTVEGHTDNQPISTDRFPSNWELSSARASSVLRYLVSIGVPAQRLSAVGYASNYPLAANSTEPGRTKNRRVEFIFTKQPPRLAVK